MTKLKNTKKGMAKKALSISLVAAMLATSNVPVWAAEDLFSDGAAVEAEVVENAEVFAPEEETEDIAPLSSVVGQGDLTVSLSVDKSTVTWGDKATISGSIVKKEDGTQLSNWKFRWLDSNGIAVVNDDATTVDDMSITPDKTLAGKTLTLYVYDNAANAADYDINTGITVTVAQRDLKDFTLTASPIYNGFSQSVANSAVSAVTDSKNVAVAAADYTVTSTSAVNKDETITVTVSANSDSAYKGSISKTVNVSAKPYATGDIIASATEGQSYQYTGAKIAIPSDKVALTESKSSNSGADGKLSGANLSSAITKAETSALTVGSQTVDLTIDTSKLKNFVAAATPLPTSLTTSQKVTITKRDLSTAGTQVTVNNGKIQTGTTVAALAGSLTLKGIDGTTLNLAASDYTITAKNPSGADVTALDQTGTYTVTITATAAGNCIGSQTFNVTTVGNVLSGASVSNVATYKPVYTGSAITPSKDDLGTLTVSGSAGSEVLQASEWEIVSYTNNIDAATYNGAISAGSIKTQAYVNIRILSGKYTGETYALPFVISPLSVQPAYITVPESISYNKNYTKAEQYNIPVTVVAKDASGKVVKTLSDSDYSVDYSFVDGAGSATGNAVNELHDKIHASVTVTNKNYILGSTDGVKITVNAAKDTEILAKALADSMLNVNPSTYTYTGGKITPNYAVIDGPLVLYKDIEYKEVSVTDSVNVGTGTIKVQGIDPYYSGNATATFAITAAKTSDVKVEISDEDYTGRQVRPRSFKATLNGNDVTSQFEIVSYGANVEAGKGTVVLKTVEGNKNFTGDNITAEFNIIKEQVKADLDIYDSKGIKVTANYSATLNSSGQVTANGSSKFTFDGNAKTFAKALLSNLTKTNNDKTTATLDDFEIKYADNITGKKVTAGFDNIAYVYAVAKDGVGFAGANQITTADGTVIKGVVAAIPFSIESVEFVKQNISVKNGTYAGGLPVKPEILIQIGGSTLVEGTDYKVSLSGGTTYTDVTNGKVFDVVIEGINGYTGSLVSSTTTGNSSLKWGIDKKNINACDVKAVNGVVTVMNGYIPVPQTEYTVKENDDKTYTVTANTTSKNYTGSKTVAAEGQKPEDKPAAPVITDVKVAGNKATVVLSGESEGATGYDYVISKDRNCITSKDYDKVNKNILTTQTAFTYTQQGTYYAYCHAWKRVDGKKVFSDWSNAYPFVVSSITPDQPVVTNVTVSGSTVKVTYTKSANATGYDIILGSAVKKVNGENRPVNYGKLVKKVTKGNTVTATFTKVPKGTYYAGLHAYNRTSENGTKVFSTWSNTKKLTVK
ncbi:MAG: hypothetical protein Q4D16_04820 [Eubacteriales bacterium]|nr:hypothetical protein [Eubacteriales bacterium]